MSNYRISVKALCLLIITILTSCASFNYTRKWDGSDIPGHNYASFVDFNGKQDFIVKNAGKGGIDFKYLINIQKGSLYLEVKTSSKIVLTKEFSGNASDSIKIDNPDGRKIRVVLKANHADGSFDIRYN